MVTKDAIITMNEGMRTLAGIKFLTSEITKLAIISTKVVANPIPSPLIALVVVASAGHIPKSRTKTGFSLTNPFEKLDN
jgi:tetrahydromethanopterin S-methyltransferase subunit E